MARVSLLFVLATALLVSQCSARIQIDGKKDLAAALTAMDKAKVFSYFLRIFRNSGFQPILARYIQSQPITLLAPTNAAFDALSLRVKSQLTGAKLIKLMEYHMLLHKLPSAYLEFAQANSFFSTVYGVYLYKRKTALKSTVIFSPPKARLPAQMGMIVKKDVCGSNLPTIAVQGISAVMIPPNVFGNIYQ